MLTVYIHFAKIPLHSFFAVYMYVNYVFLRLLFFSKATKGAITLMPILGIPWLFGLVPTALTNVWLLYIFSALNATQVNRRSCVGYKPKAEPK